MSLVKCSKCGKEISENAAFCPNCGESVENNKAKEVKVKKKKTNGLALAGMIVGICSMLIDPVGLVAITGLVLSIVGMVQVKSNNQNGKGFALTGIILSSIEFVLKFIQILLMFLG